MSAVWKQRTLLGSLVVLPAVVAVSLLSWAFTDNRRPLHQRSDVKDIVDTSDYPPLSVAQSLERPDARVTEWLESIADRKPHVSAEAQIDALDALLLKTHLNAQSLAEIGLAMGELSSPTLLEDAAVFRFLSSSVAKAEHELSLLTPPDKRAKRLVEVVWKVALHWNNAEFQLKCRAYPLLLRWEPFGTSRHFLARYKYGFALLGNGDAKAAGLQLDALTADVDRGSYPLADAYKLAELGWRIRERNGDYDGGLALLRAAADHARDERAVFDISELLILELASRGYADEVAERYQRWKQSPYLEPETQAKTERILSIRLARGERLQRKD